MVSSALLALVVLELLLAGTGRAQDSGPIVGDRLEEALAGADLDARTRAI